MNAIIEQKHKEKQNSNLKKMLYVSLGVVGIVLTGFVGYKLIKGKKAGVEREQISNIIKIRTDEPETLYHGVAMTKLNEIAKGMNKGEKCYLDNGVLYFQYKSNRGHHTFRDPLFVKNGKLVNYGGHFQNQWYSSADQFADNVNELISFVG